MSKNLYFHYKRLNCLIQPSKKHLSYNYNMIFNCKNDPLLKNYQFDVEFY